MRNFIFLLLSIIIVILSIIVIFISPIISGRLSNGIKLWKTINCQRYLDICDTERIKIRNEGVTDVDSIKERLDKFLKLRNICHRKKAMYGLEYASIISDLYFGIIIILLSILNYTKENYSRYIGLISIIIGIISSVLTLIYMVYSSYIFNNDTAFLEDYNINDLIPRLNENRAFAYYDKENGKFMCYYYQQYYYDITDDLNFFIKYKDLGQKQYNYNEKFEKEYHNINSEIYNCTITEMNDLLGNCSSFHDKTISRSYFVDRLKYCENFYYYNNNIDNSNKKLYDKLLTSIIFSCFIIGSYIAIISIGFFMISWFLPGIVSSFSNYSLMYAFYNSFMYGTISIKNLVLSE